MGLGIVRGLNRLVGLANLELRQRREELSPLWAKDKQFLELMRAVRGHSLITEDRLFILYQVARNARTIDGEIAEVGVFQGGSGKLLAKVCPEKEVHLFDTFQGMPEVNESLDIHRKGEFAETSLEVVQAFCSDCANVHFHPGFFPETSEPVREKKFAMVHIDADIYQSVKDCIEFFYERMTPGGFMVFDDYEFWATPGSRVAIDEFLEDKPESPIKTAHFQCVIVKR